jgi:hypothetical protein
MGTFVVADLSDGRSVADFAAATSSRHRQYLKVLGVSGNRAGKKFGHISHDRALNGHGQMDFFVNLS